MAPSSAQCGDSAAASDADGSLAQQLRLRLVLSRGGEQEEQEAATNVDQGVDGQQPQQPRLLALPTHSALGDTLSTLMAFAQRAIEVDRLSPDALWFDWKPASADEKTPTRRRHLGMIAAFYGCVEVLGYLLAQGLNPNAQSEDDGFTALHCAAEGCSPQTLDVLQQLLQSGADAHLCDHVGRRPVDLLTSVLSSNSDATGADNAGSASAKANGGSKRGSSSGAGSAGSSATCSSVECASNSTGDASSRCSSPALPAASNDGDSCQGKSDPANNDPRFLDPEFRMYCYKVEPCTREEVHDWTECPFAHPGEKAVRRDVRQYSYTGIACPDFRKGTCKRGVGCPYAHGVFECWLHPSRYQTQMCKDEGACTRKVCFFAHSPEEQRHVPPPEAPVLPEKDAATAAAEKLEKATAAAEAQAKAAADKEAASASNSPSGKKAKQQQQQQLGSGHGSTSPSARVGRASSAGSGNHGALAAQGMRFGSPQLPAGLDTLDAVAAARLQSSTMGLLLPGAAAAAAAAGGFKLPLGQPDYAGLQGLQGMQSLAGLASSLGAGSSNDAALQQAALQQLLGYAGAAAVAASLQQQQQQQQACASAFASSQAGLQALGGLPAGLNSAANLSLLQQLQMQLHLQQLQQEQLALDLLLLHHQQQQQQEEQQQRLQQQRQQQMHMHLQQQAGAHQMPPQYMQPNAAVLGCCPPAEQAACGPTVHQPQPTPAPLSVWAATGFGLDGCASPPFASPGSGMYDPMVAWPQSALGAFRA